MSMQDPVSDMIACLRNAQAIGIKEIQMPFSQMKGRVLQVLKEEGYIEDFAETAAGKKKTATVVLKYYQGRPVIKKMQRVSCPSRRVYRSCDRLPLVRGGLGIAVVSTPKGVMSDRAARAARVGGEIVCIVE